MKTGKKRYQVKVEGSMTRGWETPLETWDVVQLDWEEVEERFPSARLTLVRRYENGTEKVVRKN